MKKDHTKPFVRLFLIAIISVGLLLSVNLILMLLGVNDYAYIVIAASPMLFVIIMMAGTIRYLSKRK